MTVLREIGSPSSVPTLLIGGTHSGVGKTSVALGLMRAFSRQGLRVQPFKVGPDFIDPSHHTLATGRRSHNLDGWMIPPAVNRQIFWEATQDADLAIIEGVMGLFDGYGIGELGSTAQLAKLLGASVVLVIDAQGMGRSAAALLQGFQHFDPAVTFLGAILNRVGSDRHRDWIQRACAQEQRANLEILGGLPRQENLHIPRRHLGLVLGGENDGDPGDSDRLDQLAEWVEGNLDLEQLYGQATQVRGGDQEPGNNSRPTQSSLLSTVEPLNQDRSLTIGIARDQAFCFHYEYNLTLLRQLGAELVEFSPLRDSALPENLHGLYFAGGYPELHAEALSQNVQLRHQIADLSHRGLPIYGECGGLMYLSQGITNREQQTYPMVGALPFTTVMTARPTLGYREIQWQVAGEFLPVHAIARGHCFHYSKVEFPVSNPTDFDHAYQLKTSQGNVETEGFWCRKTLASYVHLHWGSCPDWPRHWLHLCQAYRQSQHQI